MRRPLEAAELFSSAFYPQYARGDQYHLHPRKRRQSFAAFRLAALVSFLAIVFVITVCGFRGVNKTLPLRWRRSLAAGDSGEESPKSPITGSEDVCGYIESLSSAASADGGSSAASSQGKVPETESFARQGHVGKRGRKTGLGGNPRKRLRTQEHAGSAGPPIDPQLEGYIEEALRQEEELSLASWLLDPTGDIPSDILAEEEPAPSSPGEGTSASAGLPLQTVRVPPGPEQSVAEGEGGAGFPREEAAPSTSGVTGASSDVSASLAEQEARLRDHPLYRYPVVPENLTLDEVKWDHDPPATACSAQLRFIRSLVKRGKFLEGEPQRLVFETTLLLSYARHSMEKDFSRGGLWEAVNGAAYMLFVLDALYTAGSMLGRSGGIDKWWLPLMDTIPRTTPRIPGLRSSDRTHEYHALFEYIMDVIDIYRSGFRPSASVLVPLKQDILSRPQLRRFNSAYWDAWRNDDKEWRGVS